jgi:hypothetical protein
VEGEKGFLDQQKMGLKSHIFRAPTHRRWGLVGLVLSLGWIYAGLPDEAPRAGLA